MLPDSDAVLAHAQDYRRRGWRVIPIIAGDKRPVTAAWQNTPEMSGADIQATFEGTRLNVGIATGAPSGFWVLDIDLDKPGTLERVKEMQAGRTMPPTRIIKTPGGGYHYYYRMPDFPVTNSARRLPDGVDVRGTGGQVVAPPSVTSKGVYTLVSAEEIADAPDWLLDLVRPAPPAARVDLATVPKLTDLPQEEQRRLELYTDRVIQAELDRLRECREKGWNGPPWNITTFEVACTLVELANSPWCSLSMVGAHGSIMEFAPRDPGFTDHDVETIFASALKKVDGKGRALPEDRSQGPVYPGDPLSDPKAGLTPDPSAAGPTRFGAPEREWSDLGNARRMVDLYGDRLRWIKEAEDWAVYEDGAWRMAGAPYALGLAQDMIEEMFEREQHHYDDEPTGPTGEGPSRRDQFLKFAKGCQSSGKIEAALKQARGRRELQADLIDFDADPYLFNCSNGVVDLRTGELTDHDPGHLMMLQSDVVYDPDAPAPRWEAFLQRCLPDPDVRHFLQKAFGYSLTGSMAEQALFIHHGSGANGKSVFLVIASHIAGAYGQVVPRETLLAKGSNNTEHPTSVARMRGKRFLQASETAAGRRLDEETVKGLTGGEQQTARHMGKDFFDFTPTGKIHFVTNHLPRLTDAESIWRRLHLIRWGEVIPYNERDPQLAQTIIREEASGVLAWAVRGAVAWATERLQVPESMKDDLGAYREDQDILGEFVQLRLERDEMSWASYEDIYGAYSAWCFNSGIRNVLTKQDLVRSLVERKFERSRRGTGRGLKAKLIPLMVSADPLAHN